RSRFRDHFNAAVSRTAVFRRKRVIVDADLQDLVLRRKAAAWKPINNEVHSTRRGSSRTGKLGQICSQLILVIGEACDELLVENRRGEVIGRIDADQARIFLNRYGLLDFGNLQAQ